MSADRPRPAAPGPAARQSSKSPASKGGPRLTAAQRVEGLETRCVRLLQRAASQIDRRELDEADKTVTAAMALASDHPEVLRVHGLVCYRRGRLQAAIEAFEQALDAWPDDPLILGNLGSVLADSGEPERALKFFARATEVAPGLPAAWFNYGKLLESQAHTEQAERVLGRTLELAPRHQPAHLLRGSALTALGHIDAAAAEYRHLIGENSRDARAWLALTGLKTVPLSPDESSMLETLQATSGWSDRDRAIVGFAFGNLLEEQGRYREAFAAFIQANESIRASISWSASEYTRRIDALRGAFGDTDKQADDASLGREVIFIVSLPRSGSTLIEQMLASHHDVEGASELPDLDAVVREECQRREQPLAVWAPQASAADWAALGRRYLERTRRWRNDRPRFTDKMPDNWLLVGAAMAMLPGARVIESRRDPLETCWSCFKQLFGRNRHGYSYELATLASAWHDYDRLTSFWKARFPQDFRTQHHEALTVDPERELRELLDFCRLDFDPACLAFNETRRTVRSASAAQVRQPLRSDTARAPLYGDLLDPLRRLLADTRTSPS